MCQVLTVRWNANVKPTPYKTLAVLGVVFILFVEGFVMQKG